MRNDASEQKRCLDGGQFCCDCYLAIPEKLAYGRNLFGILSFVLGQGIFVLGQGMEAEVTPTFSGEVMLAGWSETHNGGAKVTFWLSDADELAAFKQMTVAKGKTAGQRLACVLIEIGDDEQPNQPEPAKAEELKGGPLAKLAGMWCQSKDFLEWLGVPTPSEARLFILEECGIDSRAELDHHQSAAAIFHNNIREPYSKWLAHIGKPVCTT